MQVLSAKMSYIYSYRGPLLPFSCAPGLFIAHGPWPKGVRCAEEDSGAHGPGQKRSRCAEEGPGAHGPWPKGGRCAERGSGAHGPGQKRSRCAEGGSGAHGECSNRPENWPKGERRSRKGMKISVSAKKIVSLWILKLLIVYASCSRTHRAGRGTGSGCAF